MLGMILGLALSSASVGQPSPPTMSLAVPACEPGEVNTASPAPHVTDQSALNDAPFIDSAWPVPATFLASLDDTGHPLIECFVSYENIPSQIPVFESIAARLRFERPRALSTVGPHGLYLVQIVSNLGFAALVPPPDYPDVPSCRTEGDDEDARLAWLPVLEVVNRVDGILALFGWSDPKAPKPSRRVNPTYPFAAEDQEIEGTVSVRMAIDESGHSSISCITASTPPGWFEKSAVDAVSQWSFAAAKTGNYIVTIKYKLE